MFEAGVESITTFVGSTLFVELDALVVSSKDIDGGDKSASLSTLEQLPSLAARQLQSQCKPAVTQ